MPTYDYRCKGCDHRWEVFQSITSKPLKKCPECGKQKAERVIGPGAGIIFKGSGFYQTDYRSESYRKAAEADKPTSDAGKSDSKPESGKTEAARPDDGAKPESGKSSGGKGK